ncbi:porin [Paraburkholderia nemoris]|uniref:porin n=1 Tax=Paraburkholderia nemoris TaxID=2793076 RepID=UPI0038B7C217
MWLALGALSLPAGAVYAQSSVTLYGIVDNSVQYAGVGGTSTTRMDSGAVLPSRWGLIGKEDIGGGAAVIFKLENGFNGTSGTSLQNGAMFGREAWVGLRGAWGQIQGGVNYSPLHTTLVTYALGGVNTLSWGNAVTNFVNIPTLRLNNSIRYVSPSVAGFTVRAAYALGANGSTTLPRTLGNTAAVGVNYSVGGFSADVDGMVQVYSPSSSVSASSPTSTGNYVIAAAKYAFRYAIISAIFEAYRGGSTSGTSAGYANRDNDFYGLSALIPIDVGYLMLSFGQYKDLTVSDRDATSYGLRYDYQLSKRTAIYTGIATVRNGSAASFTVNGAAGSGVPVGKPGQNVVAVIAGITHSF